MSTSTAVIIAAAVIAVVIIVFTFRHFRISSGVIRLSHLRCEKCGGQFDYAWIPGVSLTAIRLFNSRLFRCPICGQWSIFNIMDTQVDPETHHCPIRIGPL